MMDSRERLKKENKQKRKKGFVFAISTLFLMLVLASLFSVIAVDQQKLAVASTWQAEADSVVSAYDAIEEGYRKILEYEGMNVSLEQGNVTIEVYHTFKFKNLYTQHVDYFAQFAEAYSPVPAKVNSEGFKVFDIVIEPANITLETVPPKFIFQVPDDPEKLEYLKGYDLQVVFKDIDTPSIRWKRIAEVAPESPDAMYFRIAAQGLNGTVSDARWISKTARSEVHLENYEGHSVLTLEKDTDGSLLYHYNPHLEMHLKTKLMLNSNARVVLQHGSIEVTGTSANKSGSIEIG